MANRTQQRTHSTIGPLENTTIIRTRLNFDLSFAEALSLVRASVLEAYARQELPFEVLAARLAEEDGVDLASIVQVFFVIQNAFRGMLKLPHVSIRAFGDVHRGGQAVMPMDRSWLTVMLKETSSGILGSCSYKAGLFEIGALEGWIAEYKSILSKAAENPNALLGQLTVA
jgi:non-ribosomal peptide synthetase component F